MRNRVNGFSPAFNGLHFDNAWPQVPDWRIPISGGVTLPIGDASMGMCGGMSYTVRDLFEAGFLPPPDGAAPAEGPLFDYVAARLLASYDLPGGPLEYIGAMSPLMPDVPARSAIIRQGWTDVRDDVDAQHLSPIGVIKVRSAWVPDIGKNHQCLVFGYDLDGSQLTLHLYDPNHHDHDVTLTMDLHADNILIACSDRTDVFAFFRTTYRPVFPSPLISSGVLRRRIGVADVVFAAADRQVHHLSLQAGVGWQTQPLGGPPAAGAPLEYVTTAFDPATRVVYRGDEGHIHELALSPEGVWIASDLFSMAPDAPTAAGDPFGDVTETFDSAARVVYRGPEGHLHELSVVPDGAWASADLFAYAAGAVAAAGDPQAYVTDDFQVAARVVYRGVDGHIHELALTPGIGWAHGDLFANLDPPPVEADGDPHGYVTREIGPAARVVYRGVDGHIHELSLPSEGSWAQGDLTAMTGAPLATGNPHAYVTTELDQAARIVFRGVDGKVIELSLAPGGTWAWADLLQHQPAPPVPAASDPRGYSTTAIDRAARVVYRGVDGHVIELFLTPGLGWDNGDLSVVAAPVGGPVIAASAPYGCATALNT